uniref:Tr-type G domain-containing protein n=1 Tax=Angiostrongylus cantonensis TaxID=6313 RepID=A0A0K0CUJ7_ANGCA
MNVSPAEIRNIGIIAHIDAGKTTVTERMLYLAGVIRHMGDVDSGDTVTDFLDLERERGITIQLAAITFYWKKHRINLIDTPGHVDFTVEVERCARILDGVITVLDGSAGVQAQTMTVWRQAAKFRLPSTFFVNKLDKREANFEESVDSVEQKLGIKALVVGFPYYSDGVIGGVVDVIAKKHIPICVDGQWNNVEVHLTFSIYRERLCCDLSDLDREFMSVFLEKYNGDAISVPSPVIIKALRRMTLANRSTVFGAGSALRCPASIRSILDHAIHFLPSPEERNTALKKLFDKELCALIFKIGHDKRKGKLGFVRVYTGVLNNNSFVYNSSQRVVEGPIKLFLAQSSELLPVSSVNEGNIAVVTGLSSAMTGDTILSRCLVSMDFPEPVYFCCVEPPSSKSIHEFERALKELAVEDPSLRIQFDTETGQTVVETMGELHMDVVKNRLIRDYGLNVFVGPLQVAYREIIGDAVSRTTTVQETLNEKQVHSATLTLHIEPRSQTGKFKMVSPDAPNLRGDWLKAINEGCCNAVHNGPVLGFPVQDVVITLKAITTSGGRVNPAVLSSCAHKCVTEAFKCANARLVEPVVQVDIVLENGVEAQTVLHELTRRRADISHCLGTTLICAHMPVSEMTGFPTTLRTVSSGLASLHVQVAEYQIVSVHDQITIVKRLKGLK